VRLLAFSALVLVFPLAAGAGQKPATQPTQPAPSAVDRKAEAYANFMLGHIRQAQFENTGDQKYADQAIAYYKKAQALDPEAVEIPLKMAQTYAESQRVREAIETANAILKAHPDSVETHRLLAQIYVRSLGETGSDADQQHTLGLAVEQYEAILKIDPGNNEAGLWLARLYRFQNQPDKAEKVLEQMLNRDPSNQHALEQYTQLLLDEGHAEQAIQRLGKVAGQEGNGRLYDLLGDAYARMHKPAQAEAAYRKAVELEPNVAAHWRRLAHTLFNENKLDEAAKAYGQLTSLDPSNANGFLRLAQIYYQQKKYALADTSIQQARQLAPGNLEVIYNVALIAEAQGHYKDAIAEISSAIADLKRQSPGTASNPSVYSILYEQLGTLYRQQGDYAAAIKTFREMMALGPAAKQHGRIQLIETYRQDNQIDEAISTAQQAMAAEPKNRQMKITYALLLGEKKETNQATTTLKSLLDGSPADRDIYLDIAQVEQRGRRYGAAEKAARTAESMSKAPEQKAKAWFMLGAIYERQKKYGPAEQMFRKALQVNPNDDQVLNYYGYMLAEQGVRLDQAEKMLKHALSLDAGNSAYLDSLGWTYYKQNRLTDAREYLLKAINHSPHDPTILGHLGDVYDRLGETELAIETWEKALAAWRRAVPADYEADRVRDIQRKLSRAKSRSARKNHAETNQPH
jgi:tetratricopeptide (TPR) repeat protein